MKNQLFRTLTVTTCAAMSVLTIACGVQNSPNTDSELNFVQGSKQQSAYLEKRDLQDSFLFGLNVIGTQNFFSNALNLNFRPVVVRLVPAVAGSMGRLNVVAGIGAQQEVLMSFNAKKTADGRIEVDFASPGNEINLFDGIGAQVTVENPTRNTAPWQTNGKPISLKVSQTADVVVADVLHKVSYTLPEAPKSGSQSRNGSVTLRMFLKRVVKSDVAQPAITVGQSKSQKIGFFPASREFSNPNSLIARYKVDTASRKEGQITVYLKNFPTEFYSVGESAVLAWNKAFGFNAIVVKPATADIDVGDPRYNVVRWFDNLDEDTRWAGYAPTMIDPTNGLVTGAQIYINGNSLLNHTEALAQYTSKVQTGFAGLHGKIGNVPVVQGAGETPVVSFFTDAKMDPKTYARGYYYSVVMHEFGHSLGLRHNFAASTLLDNGSTSSSVMDYEPNWSTAGRTAIGSYDSAAIRWGYFAEKPAQTLLFCTDEDVKLRIDCNQGDFGNPVDHALAALLNGVGVLENLAVALPGTVYLPMKGAIAAGFKIQSLISQVPAEKRAQVQADLDIALNKVKNASPAPALSVADKSIVSANLVKLAKSYSEVVTENTTPNAIVSAE